MKNKIKIITDNQTVDLNVSKIVKIKTSDDKELICFDKLKDGSWRMVYKTKEIKEISK